MLYDATVGRECILCAFYINWLFYAISYNVHIKVRYRQTLIYTIYFPAEQQVAAPPPPPPPPPAMKLVQEKRVKEDRKPTGRGALLQGIRSVSETHTSHVAF